VLLDETVALDVAEPLDMAVLPAVAVPLDVAVLPDVAVPLDVTVLPAVAVPLDVAVLLDITALVPAGDVWLCCTTSSPPPTVAGVPAHPDVSAAFKSTGLATARMAVPATR
jgi:hypothetical protein